MINSEAISKPNLRGIGELIKASWDLFLKLFFKLFVIALLGGIVLGGLALMFMGFGLMFGKFPTELASFSGPLVAVFGLGAGISTLILIWVTLSLIIAIIRPDLGSAGCLRMAIDRYGGYLWLSILTAGIIFFGFLLLFVPGILFSIWFIFGAYVFVEEGRPGLEALKRSRQLVSGYAWPVFGRLLILWLIMLGVSIIPIIGRFLQLLTGLFSFVYFYLIYKNLRDLKG